MRMSRNVASSTLGSCLRKRESEIGNPRAVVGQFWSRVSRERKPEIDTLHRREGKISSVSKGGPKTGKDIDYGNLTSAYRGTVNEMRLTGGGR